MKLSLTIDGVGDAFDGVEFLGEMARCVERIPLKILQGSYSGVVLDINGNRCGEWTIS